MADGGVGAGSSTGRSLTFGTLRPSHKVRIRAQAGAESLTATAAERSVVSQSALSRAQISSRVIRRSRIRTCQKVRALSWVALSWAAPSFLGSWPSSLSFAGAALV